MSNKLTGTLNAFNWSSTGQEEMAFIKFTYRQLEGGTWIRSSSAVLNCSGQSYSLHLTGVQEPVLISTEEATNEDQSINPNKVIKAIFKYFKDKLTQDDGQ